MASLVHALAAGVSPAPSGTAEFYSQGTATLSTLVYSDPNGLTAVTTHTLDAYGSIIRYVGESVDVVVKTSAGATVRSFTHIEDGRVVRVETSPFSGPSTSGNGQTVVGGRTTATAALSQVGLSGATTASGSFEVFNVVSYGANILGTTDSGAAIASAISAAVAAGGGVVYFPAGTYKITAALALNYANVHIVGDGAVSIIKNHGTTTNTFFLNPGALTDYNSSISRIAISTNTTSTGAGIRTSDVRRLLISDVKITGHREGCLIDATSDTSLLHVVHERVYVSLAGVAASSGSAAFYANGRAIHWQDCYALGGAASGDENGFQIVGASGAGYCTLLRCFADSMATGTAYGFVLNQAVNNVSLIGCSGTGNDLDFYAYSTSGANITTLGCQFASQSDGSTSTASTPRNNTATTSSADAAFTVTPDFSPFPSDANLHQLVISTYAVGAPTVTVANPDGNSLVPPGTILEFTFSKAGANTLNITWGNKYLSANASNAFGGLASVATVSQASVRFRKDETQDAWACIGVSATVAI
jgi:hypothetical protein